ncbi:MAG: flagellar hook-associated protein FlgK [Candidatus Solibacter sp.]
MSNLFAVLRTSANALDVFQSALSVTANNVANASTPGYVRQTQGLKALPFSPSLGLSGGVAATQVETARDVYAEHAVQLQVTSLGTAEQQVATLSPIQNSFDITGTAGIPGSLNQLYSAFSAWSTMPNDGSARQGVMAAAGAVSQAFLQQSDVLDRAASGADSQLTGLVDQVNKLAATIQQINGQRARGNGKDPSLDADLYNAVEQLSQLVPVQTLQQADGSTTVLLAGQIPLVVGQFQYQISSNVGVPAIPPATNPSGPPSAQILDSNGRDVTASIRGGQIGGLLQARNGVLAQLRGDSQQQGQLNLLAQSVADRVNALFVSGNISAAVAGTPALPGVPLFTYDPTKPSSMAQTLSVDPAMTAGQLAAIDPGPPAVSNGIALKLAGLATPQTAADEIANVSYTQFFGNMAASLGSAISTARADQATQQGLVTQAQDLRQQTSGVSLDSEAIKILEFQRSYQAVSKMVTMLDQLTQTVINMIQ